jgi:uncharacterized lipoprotein YmbA
MSRRPLLAVAILACACATPASRFYTLSAAPASAPTATMADVSVAVGPVTVPMVVDRPQIVVTVNSSQVWLDELNRWASPLANNIARVVAENLVTLLGTPHVMLSPQAAAVDYRTAIEVQRFEYGARRGGDHRCRVDGEPRRGRPVVLGPHDRAGAGAGQELRHARRRA